MIGHSKTHTMKFTAEIPVDILNLESRYNIPNIDFEAEPTVAKVEFSCHINQRKWGIKCIDVEVTRVTIDFKVYVENEGLDNVDFKKLVNLWFSVEGNRLVSAFNVDTNSEDWYYESEIEITPSGCIRPEMVSIDFRTKKIYVE